MGEGRPGRTVAVERLGLNAARALPDVGGALPPQAILDPSAPSSRPARLRFDPSWFAAAAYQVSESHDAGGNLCNEMLFTALGQAVGTCGFVHVPPQGDEPDERYGDHFVAIVRELIARNLAP